MRWCVGIRMQLVGQRQIGDVRLAVQVKSAERSSAGPRTIGGFSRASTRWTDVQAVAADRGMFGRTVAFAHRLIA
jgi:hypothetical protein